MKLGIVGLGRRMTDIVARLLEAEPDLEVAGCVDCDPEKARLGLPEELRDGVPFFDSLDELVRVRRPDALAIGTRCDSHADYAIQAAPYGLPVFLEKPVAISMSQAVALESAFEKASCPVLISFPLRVSTLCQRAKQILDQGVIGSVEHIMARNYVTYGNVYFETWHRDYAVTQGLFLQKATHDFDYLAFLAESPITRVAAMRSVGRIYRDTSTKGKMAESDALYLDQIGTPETGMNEDSSSALLEFASGAKGVYTQVFYSKRVPMRGAILSGFEGMLEFDWYQNSIKTVHHRQPFTDISTVDGAENHFGGDIKLAEHFVGMVRNGQSSSASLATGLASVYACLAAKESAETCRFVDVRQVGALL